MPFFVVSPGGSVKAADLDDGSKPGEPLPAHEVEESTIGPLALDAATRHLRARISSETLAVPPVQLVGSQRSALRPAAARQSWTHCVKATLSAGLHNGTLGHQKDTAGNLRLDLTQQCLVHFMGLFAVGHQRVLLTERPEPNTLPQHGEIGQVANPERAGNPISEYVFPKVGRFQAMLSLVQASTMKP